MKTMCLSRVVRPVSLAVSLVLAGLSSSLAQTATNSLIPVVTVLATQPVATTNQPGVFTVYRAGNTDATLNVWYDLGGTASNGMDYALIPPHLVAIAAGATSNTIVIAPTSNPPGTIFPKTVVVTLTNSPLMTPVNYEIGSPSQAMVYLESTNLPPTVRITSPADGAKLYTPTNIFLSAWTLGQFPVTNVEFFAGTNSLGFGSPYFAIGAYPAGNFQPYFLVWSNAPVGAYVLTAIGRDNTGVSVTSAPVNITVLQGPPTNLPPAVTIFAPPSGAVFFTPTNVQILAKASDRDGFVTNLEFFAGTNDLGPGSAIVLDPPGVNGFAGLVYWFNWVNPSPGNYPLTAVATDNGDLSTTSAPVNITVQQGPATNLPPVVRIISPPDGAVFRAPIKLPLYAYARASESGTDFFFDEVTNLEFYADGTDLGSARHVFYGPPMGPGPNPLYVVVLPHRFFLVWSNAPVGPHQLTAVAEDQFGNAATSAPVNLTILASPPPPTNRPPVVSIVATDPMAIEGTNAWVWPGETNSTPTWAAWPPRPVGFFTNRGPKTATFAVRRYGDISNDLTVAYAIGGTASNGVDYATLPGSVTIPAGERRALISIVPIDDGPPDVNSTVMLALSPSTNTPPDYVIGWPPRAAAIIIDRAGPQPLAGVLPGGWFHLAAPGPNAAWFGVEYSTDLIHWTPVCTNQVVNGSIDFVDPEAASRPARFYRTVPVNGPP